MEAPPGSARAVWQPSSSRLPRPVAAPGPGTGGARDLGGPITNVHAVGGEVEATYTVNFTDCGEAPCRWYPYALQYPTSQSRTPGGSQYAYVGGIHSADGTETATDNFYPKTCVAAGRQVQLRVVTKTKRALRGKRPSTRVSRSSSGSIEPLRKSFRICRS